MVEGMWYPRYSPPHSSTCSSYYLFQLRRQYPLYDTPVSQVVESLYSAKWQRDLKGTTFTHATLYGYLPTVCIDHLFDQRQS